MKDKYSVLIVLLLLVPLVSTVFLIQASDNYGQTHLDQISEEPVQPSQPTNVVIRESAIYDAPEGDARPISHFEGLVYWEELAGAGLSFFINTSNVIEHRFIDFESGDPFEIREECRNQNGPPDTDCVMDMGDRYFIFPGDRSFKYEIDAYYDPDVVEDTGFIVVFNSQSVDFSLEVDGEQRFARVDYTNKITLPLGAGIVSYAPIDNGFLGLDKTDDGRWQLEWEYINRQMDTKHDPLLISVTYAFDEIFLSFTEQVYQQQQQQRERQQELNRLNLLQQSFVIIATLAIVASLFSILFAYLLARRRYEPKLQSAKELPRREVLDIEASDSLQVPVKSLFLSAMIILPMLFAPGIPMVDGQAESLETIKWDGTYDLRRDLTLTESVTMELPITRDIIYIYTNTSAASNFEVTDEFGTPLRYETEDNRFVVQDPGFTFSYSFDRPYEVANNSQMLVFLDRFWIEFVKPPEFQEQDDLYFHVDLKYTVLLPVDAILYSASPSDKLIVDRSSTPGRTNVTFTDQDRKMDAFHDVWETQVTFSFVNILDALDNLNSDFVQLRAEEQSLESLVQIAATEILLFSLLGLIAPLISFLMAYWVFRRRYKKQIERAEKEQEEQIFVEEPQILALSQAVSKDASEKLYEAYKGHYWRLIERLERLIDRTASRLEPSIIMRELDREGVTVDQGLLMQALSMGAEVQEGETVGYDQLAGYAKLVDEVIEELNN